MTNQIKSYVVAFVLLWLHVTVLDLFYVTPNAIVFLWSENLAPLTILVHFLTALVATIFYIGITEFRKYIAGKNRSMSDKFWLISSVLLVGLIGYFFVS